MTHDQGERAAGGAHQPMQRPPGTVIVLLAGALDQLVLIAVAVLGFGAGLLAAESGGGGTAISIGIGTGLGGLVACVVVQIRVAVRTGVTAGLFLLGMRLDPSRPIHWADDAGEWLLAFWEHVVLLPLISLMDRLTGRERDGVDGIEWDARARRGGSRLARLLLAAALLASPVPLVLAFRA